ncbi:MAG: hypothetical protein FJY75_14135 [Candidatus Eisenbacteria bacterium]|uniref:Uncharacterized protein n=1 Tax=Eiseniibacteriota bacterium TaxID=2212470 RepID=A0A937XB49_UNCEI|nr:hypothetical protein [Candidatus Eisenbacteria bacterium]
MRVPRAILPWLLLGCAAVAAGADSLENSLSAYSGENGRKYMQPLADAIVANLNSGLFSTAAIDGKGFSFSIGLAGMVALIGDDQRTFTATTEAPFSPEQSAEAPTIFGTTEGVPLTGTGGTVYTLPGGFDVDKFPTAVPQMMIGGLRGTEALVRFAAATPDEEFGQIRLLGLGVRHSLSQYWARAPLDLAAGVFWQSFRLGDIVDARTICLGLQGSLTKGVLTGYTGLAYESGTVDLEYTQEVAGEEVELAYDLDAANTMRWTIGLALELAFVRLHADYNLASQSTIAVGLGFGHWKH